VGEVEEYARSIESPADARKWWDRFQELGWKINGEPLADWKAVFRSTHEWERWRPDRTAGPARREDYQPSAERIEANAKWLEDFLNSPEGGGPIDESGTLGQRGRGG